VFDQPLSLTESGEVVVVRGTVDEYALVDLREQLADAVRRGSVRYIDVSGVDLLPSAALGILAATRASAARDGHSIEIVATPETFAQRVLAAVGIPHLTELPGA
jgi:anti-anti-sigma regulatory factor